MEDFSSRFVQIIDFQTNGNKKKFAEITKIPYSTVVEYAKGIKKDPKLSLLTKIKNVNAEWLLTGNGDPNISHVGSNIEIDALVAEVSNHDARLKMLELKVDAINVLILKQVAETPTPTTD